MRLRMLRLAGIRLALAAMLLQALLPSGWMPNTTESPGAPFVICTINGPLTFTKAVHAPSGPPSPARNDAHHMDACPFSAAPHFATFAAGAVHAVSGIEIPALKQRFASQRIADHQVQAPHAPRAPPIFV